VITVEEGDDQDEGPATPGAALPQSEVEIVPDSTYDAIKQGDTVTYVGRVVITKTGTKGASIVFQTKGAGTHWKEGSGTAKEVTLTFNKFTLTKLVWEGTSTGGPGEEEEVDVKGFIEELEDFEELVVEKKSFADKDDSFAHWVFDVAKIGEADYFVFAIDGAKSSIGGIKIGFQNDSNGWKMSDGVFSADTTTVTLAGVTLIAIDVTKLEDYTEDQGDAGEAYQGVTDGNVRIYIGYWVDGTGAIATLNPTGYAALVKGDLKAPDGATELKLKGGSDTLGFIAEIKE